MATFALVHGAFHGAWCWIKLIPELEARGHSVVVFDLPGGGEDTTPINEVTFDYCVARIVERVAAVREPVILVGHSLGGIFVGAAAERIPERIRKLVYLTAFILRDGQSLYTLLDPAAPADSVPPPDSSWNIVSSAVPGTDVLRDMFYNGCSNDDVAFALRRLKPQANAPRLTRVSLSAQRYERVPRCFIECTDDRAISIDTQRAMVANSPCEKVLSLDTGHSPFFAAPAELASAFTTLA